MSCEAFVAANGIANADSKFFFALYTAFDRVNIFELSFISIIVATALASTKTVDA
jgi:hypothetical protein